MWRKVPGLLAVIALIVIAAISPALGEKRVALVLGNNVYANVPSLQKAVADASAVRDTLEALDFEVIYAENVALGKTKELFFEFSDKLSQGDIAFVFFAGHGVALGGANYLLPSDFPAVREPQSEAAIMEEEQRLAEFALSEAFVIQRIKAKGARVGIVVLDACRDNPLRVAEASNPFRSARPGDLLFGASRGLARVQGHPEGIFSIYSANFGQAALDRLGPDDPHPNSPFTRVFLKHLASPGKGLRTVMVETREEVVNLARSVGVEQRPALYDEVTGGDLFLAGGALMTAPADTDSQQPSAAPEFPRTEVPVDSCAAANDHWRTTESIGTKAVYEDHLARFATCAFAGLARERLAALALIAPGEPPPSTHLPRKIHTEGMNGPTFVRGSFTNLGSGEWVEENTENPGNPLYFTLVSQTPSEFVLYDDSRDLYLEISLAQQQTRWKRGNVRNWNILYKVVKVEK